ncbi:putative sporulation protein YtaF [Desulfitispora alkaliphila]|uniref:sporulation membrane protein YtaF n=1 Tax=Desulfitispora alkaliphila TaxID=622674 RepID=UPI003D1A1A95
MEIIAILLFAFAVSLDGFGAGVAYGLREIKIPLKSLLIISLASTFAISLSMFSGQFIASLFSVTWAERLGSVILISMGFWIIMQALAVNKSSDDKKVIKINIKMLGIVIQVMREPAKADFDSSGVISSREACVLGFALAMDALGAGFGAAMTGFTPYLTPIIVGIFKFVLLTAGLWLGGKSSGNWLGAKAGVLPGVVLILLGIM